MTGLVDAASYLSLGHVFTANMTGNVVLLGFAVAGAQGLSVSRSGVALVAFLAGAVIGGRIATWMSRGPQHRWTAVAFGAEAALLLAAMAVAIGGGTGLAEVPAQLYAIIVLTGLAMGLRAATIRKLGVLDITTTVLTSTLASLAADSVLAGGNNQGWGIRVASIVTMLAGAGVGAWLIRYSVVLPFAASGVLSSACAVAAYRLGGRCEPHGSVAGS